MARELGWAKGDLGFWSALGSFVTMDAFKSLYAFVFSSSK